MLIPTNVRVEASMSEQLVDYRCSRCALETQAWVTSSGTGLELAGVSLSDANLDARASAANAADLARCPRCGRRGRAALLKVLLAGAALGVVAGMAAGFVAADQLYGSDPGGHLGLAVGVAAFLAAVAATTAYKLRKAARRVRFLGGRR